MQRMFTCVAVMLVICGVADARGVLLPAPRPLPPPGDKLPPITKPQAPLPMVSHDVKISIEDQVAVTNIEQVFRNNTGTEVEATYIFPIPNGASVRKFSMWANGKEIKGELIEADKARKIYTEMVQ